MRALPPHRTAAHAPLRADPSIRTSLAQEEEAEAEAEVVDEMQGGMLPGMQVIGHQGGLMQQMMMMLMQQMAGGGGGGGGDEEEEEEEEELAS